MRKVSESLPMVLLQAREVTMEYFRPILNQHSVTEQQWRIIRALKENGELEARHLAEVCCILSPSLTGIVKRMERDGFIERRRPDSDHRRTCISLSAKGEKLFDSIAPALEESHDRLNARVGRKRLDKLLALLHEVKSLGGG
ncbi:MAG: homoprotocatechuate degradation operon regulator HpaR [Hyphomicrobiales bacterium]|nr:homoprotocatechuate degradation operon regulator HpaR [Hyphomicrobiales bacterium]